MSTERSMREWEKEERLAATQEKMRELDATIVMGDGEKSTNGKVKAAEEN
jgi:hypothetical protein